MPAPLAERLCGARRVETRLNCTPLDLLRFFQTVQPQISSLPCSGGQNPYPATSQLAAPCIGTVPLHREKDSLLGYKISQLPRQPRQDRRLILCTTLCLCLPYPLHVSTRRVLGQSCALIMKPDLVKFQTESREFRRAESHRDRQKRLRALFGRSSTPSPASSSEGCSLSAL